MEAYKERVLKEKAELDERLHNLVAFITGVGGKTFFDLPDEDRALLMEQSLHMKGYCECLQKRIERFQ